MKGTFITLVILLSGAGICSKRSAVDTDEQLKQLFFQLDVDLCPDQLNREIRNSTLYKFVSTSHKDTFRFKDSMRIVEVPALYPHYKLANKGAGLIDCDSIFVQLQPAYVSRFQSHGKIDYPHLYGHRISVLMYVSDSIRARTTYNKFRDTLSKRIDRIYSSGDLTIDNTVAGNSTTFVIDKRGKKNNYERDLEFSIRHYPSTYELKLDFVKLTAVEEKCR